MVMPLSRVDFNFQQVDDSALHQLLLISLSDLKTVTDRLRNLLSHQCFEYVAAREEVKIRMPHDLIHPMFRAIKGRVTLFALREMYKQSRRFTAVPTTIESCTKSFRTTMGLSCAHEIQNRVFDEQGGMILLKNVHPH